MTEVHASLFTHISSRLAREQLHLQPKQHPLLSHSSIGCASGTHLEVEPTTARTAAAGAAGAATLLQSLLAILVIDLPLLLICQRLICRCNLHSRLGMLTGSVCML